MKRFLLVTAVIASLAVARPGKAALGWTLAECQQNYHSEATYDGEKCGLDCYSFQREGFNWISVLFEYGRVIAVRYSAPSVLMDEARVQRLLKHNAPTTAWGFMGRSKDRKIAYFGGIDGGSLKYYATLEETVFSGTKTTLLQISTMEPSDRIKEQRQNEKY